MSMQFIARTKLLPKVKIKYDNGWNWISIKNPNLMPRRYNSISAHTTIFKAFKQLIMENLGLENDEAKRLLHKNQALLSMSMDRIAHNCQICQNENIDMKGTLNNLKFLELSEEQLEERILLLKEMGAIHINTTMIASCAARVHVATFKAYSKISKEEIISEKLYSFLHSPPSDVPALGPISELMTINEYRKKCLSHYIKWRLEIPESRASTLRNIIHRLRYRSFSRLRHTFDILHEDVGMSIDMIRDNKCLENGSSINLHRILNEVPTVCGISVKDLMLKHPGLHKMKYKNVSVAKILLEKNNFSSEQLENAPRVLLLDSENLEDGLNTINNTPELKVLIEHPKVLEILLTSDGISRRIHYLRYLSIRDATVGMLGSPVAQFERYLKMGIHRHKGREISITLEKHIHMNFLAIESELKRHPFWRHVDLLTIHNTLSYLQPLCDIKDIHKNLQLLLYSKEKVESTLTALTAMNKIVDEKDRYTSSQLLALCAYQIEKEYHFTGDGVWDKSQDFKVPRSHEELLQETEEWKRFRDKHPLNDVNIFLFINMNKNQRSA